VSDPHGAPDAERICEIEQERGSVGG
jgi:hypothetical protein